MVGEFNLARLDFCQFLFLGIEGFNAVAVAGTAMVCRAVVDETGIDETVVEDSVVFGRVDNVAVIKGSVGGDSVFLLLIFILVGLGWTSS